MDELYALSILTSTVQRAALLRLTWSAVLTMLLISTVTLLSEVMCNVVNMALPGSLNIAALYKIDAGIENVKKKYFYHM